MIDDDSQVELPALEPGGCLSDDDFPAYTDDRASGEIAVANRWYFKLIDSWARYHFVVALAFGALSIAILGFSLSRAVVGAQTVSLSITALVTGGVTLVAFSFLLVTATALNLVLVDLARTVRRLKNSSRRETGAARG